MAENFNLTFPGNSIIRGRQAGTTLGQFNGVKLVPQQIVCGKDHAMAAAATHTWGEEIVTVVYV